MTPTLPDADQMAVIKQGRLLLNDPPDQVLADAAWPREDIELPLAVSIGRQLGMTPLPHTLEGLPDSADHTMPSLYGPTVQKITTAAGSPILSLEKVSYAIKGRPIVRNVSMKLHPGQCAALVGANGAGKTTLLKLINGLLCPASGTISIHGRNCSGTPAWQLARHIGTAFQNPNNQFFKLTVDEEIRVGPLALDCYDAQWIDELITLFQLEPLLPRAPFKLSGGEKKRVAIAAALAVKPAILTLDEPTAGQDGHFRQALTSCLQRMCHRGTAILIVTHALNFAETLADRWMVMAGGRLIADGPPQQIMADAKILAGAGLAPTEAFTWWQKNRQAV